MAPDRVRETPAEPPAGRPGTRRPGARRDERGARSRRRGGDAPDRPGGTRHAAPRPAAAAPPAPSRSSASPRSLLRHLQWPARSTTSSIAQVGAYLVAVAGLTVLTGLNGQISLGQGALMCIGAYAAALIMLHTHVPLAGVLVLSALAAGARGVDHRDRCRPAAGPVPCRRDAGAGDRAPHRRLPVAGAPGWRLRTHHHPTHPAVVSREQLRPAGVAGLDLGDLRRRDADRPGEPHPQPLRPVVPRRPRRRDRGVGGRRSTLPAPRSSPSW